MSHAIGREAKQQGELLDSLESAMDQAQAALRMGMKRLDGAMKNAKSNHILYLLLFAVAMVFLVVLLRKLAGVIRFILCLPSPILGHYCSRKK